MPRAPDFRYRPRSRPMSGPVDPDLQSTRNIGARAGSRTLNLGIKRRQVPCVRECQRVPGSAKRAPAHDAPVSPSVRDYQRVSA